MYISPIRDFFQKSNGNAGHFSIVFLKSEISLSLTKFVFSKLYLELYKLSSRKAIIILLQEKELSLRHNL